MTILSNELPIDMQWDTNTDYPGLLLTKHSSSTSWNNRSAEYHDIIIDPFNNRKIISMGLPKVFNINERCVGRPKSKIIFDDSTRVFSFDEARVFIVSRYKGVTYIRRPNEFPKKDLIKFNNSHITFLNMLNDKDTIPSSFIFTQSDAGTLQLITIVDHVNRGLVRLPTHVIEFAQQYNLSILHDPNIRDLNILGDAARLYKKTYWIHRGTGLVKVQDNWFGLSTCLNSRFTLDNLIKCWIAFPSYDFITFKHCINHIHCDEQSQYWLKLIHAASKLILITKAKFASAIMQIKHKSITQLEFAEKIPLFLQFLFWDMVLERETKHNNLSKLYLKIIQNISAPVVDKPLLLTYNATELNPV